MATAETNGNHIGLRSSTEDLSEYTDADESISAPTEILAEFLSSVMLKDYETALKYCKIILQYEPNNATAREFYPLIVEKLQILEDERDESDCEESSSSSSDENSSSCSSSCSSSDKNQSDATTGSSYSSLEDDEDLDSNCTSRLESDLKNGNLTRKPSIRLSKSQTEIKKKLTEEIKKKLTISSKERHWKPVTANQQHCPSTSSPESPETDSGFGLTDSESPSDPTIIQFRGITK